MKNCPVCSTPAQEGERFCGVCGTLFETHDSGPIRTEPADPGPRIPSQSSRPKTGEEAGGISEPTARLGPRSPFFHHRQRFLTIFQPALLFLFSVVLLGLLLYNAIDEVSTESKIIWENKTIDDNDRENMTNKHTTFNSNQTMIFIVVLILVDLILVVQLRTSPYKGILAPCLGALVLLLMLMVGAYLQDPPQGYDEQADIYLDQYGVTIAFALTLLASLIAYIVFLYSVTDKKTKPGSMGSMALFLVAGITLTSTLFHNYYIGPWNSGNQIVPINLEPADVAIVLLANLILLMGVGHYLLRVVGITDMEEVRYFSFIIAGLGVQYLALVLNFARNQADLRYELADLVATFLGATLIVIGMAFFYLKRRELRSFEASGYFGIFVTGVFALILFFVIPIILSGSDLTLDDRDQWPVLFMSLLVALVGLYLLLQYARRELGQRLDELKAKPAPDGEGPGTPPPEPVDDSKMSLDEAFDKILSEFPESTIDVKPKAEDDPSGLGMDWEGVKSFMDGQEADDMLGVSDQEAAGELRDPVRVNYKVSYNEITEAFSTSRDTINQIVTHLKSGKNVMLYGEPGTGKTKLSTLILNQICGNTTNAKGQDVPNFTIVTANAEWSNFEVIGGIAPDDKGGYYFKDGYVAEAAKRCERSIQERGSPHYLVIDEFNRANIDEAFGKLFTVFEYRDKQPLLTGKENRGMPFMMPPEFRIIGTMNTKDKNTLFNVGHALMRRFSFVEIPLPNKEEEFRRMPEFVWDHMEKLGGLPGQPPVDDSTDWFAQEKFDFYDDDSSIYNAYVKLMGFMEEEEEPGRDEEVPRGVRTYRKIGPAALIDSMVTLVNARDEYDLGKALEDVIHANVMPSMEGMEKQELRCIRLKALETLGPNSGVTHTLERMIESPSLSMFG